MKFLFDQNISFRVLKQLPAPFSNASHVKFEKLMNAPDREIWEYARLHDYTIITQDADFNDLNLLYGFPPKIIWIRVGNLKTTDIMQVLIAYQQEIQAFMLDSTHGCFEIIKLKE
jgi:predicted nuclease of predicted toxin-antitoxin system